MRHRRHRFFGPSLGVMLALTAGPAGANGLCQGLQLLVEQAQEGFAEVVEPPAAFKGAACQTALEVGGKSYFCAWEHPLKAPEAANQARAFEREIESCFPQATFRTDVGVNHPDSYDAREYLLPTARLTVAVKDKAQLGRTLVFLRVGW